MEFYKEEKKINDISNIKDLSNNYLQINVLIFKILKFQ